MSRAAVLLLLFAAAAAAQEWKLGPSDWARYEERAVTRKDGKERFGKARIVSVHGHDIRGGQYAPASLKRGDLPSLLGLHVPRDDDFRLRLRVAGVTELRFRCQGEIKESTLVADWLFKSQGKQEKKEAYRIQKGKAHIVATFDAQKGVVSGARVEISYVLRKRDPKPGEKPKTVTKVFDIRLKEILRHRHADFRKQVNAAIDKGVKHLKTLQKEDGNFEPHGNWDFGTNALAVLTLCACDVPVSDPSITRALALMDKVEPKRTYALALGLMAYERVYTPPGEAHRKQTGELKRDLPPHRRAWCVRAARYLESIVASAGGWEYKVHNSRFITSPDSSNTQYGALGLRAAARMGIEIKERAWVGVIRHFALVREKDGRKGSVALLREGQALGEVEPTRVPKVAGFKYRFATTHPWGSMTCAGIAAITIARHQLEQTKSAKATPTLRRKVDEMVLGGWAWLDKNWAIDRNPHKDHGGAWYFYYLYSLERAGILTGVKRVGGRDWYYEGAVQLIARQHKKKGSWNEGGGEDLAETCFALLFLKRATAPLSGGQ